MSLNTLIYELFRFIKDNITKLLLSALVVSLVLTGGKYYLTTKDQEEEDLASAYESLLTVYEQEPAEFKFIIQNEDGTFFDNSFIIDEYLTQPDVVQQLESISQVPFQATLDYEQLLELYKTSKFRGGLVVIRDTSTNLMTARIQIASESKDNLAIASAIEQLIKQSDIPFLKGKEVTVFQTSSIGETIDPEANPLADPLSELEKPATGMGIKSLVRSGVLGLVAGFILTAGGLFIYRLLDRKIRYGFEYSWDLNDQHLLYQPQKYPGLTLNELIDLSQVSNQLILDQTAESEAANWSKGINHLTQTVPVEEIVFIIRPEKTTKEWYDEQYTLSKLYHCPLRIIHVVE